MLNPTIDVLIVSKSRLRKGTRPDRSSPRTDASSKKRELKEYDGPLLKSGEFPLESWLSTYKRGFRNDNIAESC